MDLCKCRLRSISSIGRIRYNAFTLIELLVVIAIIGLLLSLLIPGLGNASENAREVVCSSQIRNILIGMQSYHMENRRFPYGFDGWTRTPPPLDVASGSRMFDELGWWWFEILGDHISYVKDGAEVVRCPSRNIDDGFEENILWGNYGVNSSVCKNARDRISNAEFAGDPLQLEAVANPSNALLAMDCGYSIFNWHQVADNPPVTLGNSVRDNAYLPGLWIINESKLLGNIQWADALDGRHVNGQINAGFVDTHVEKSPADRYLVQKQDEAYSGLYPYWRPKQ